MLLGSRFGLWFILWTMAGAAGLWAQEPELRYNATQLNCARFRETSRSTIITESAGRVREQTAGRDGVWRFRASPAVDHVAVEGWLDSLSLWRKSNETMLRPDTDGIIGGRYRGTLGSAGVYHSQSSPFVPDEVAEVAGMSDALNDFFPPLPGPRLRPGQSWSDSSGLTIRRLADSGLSGVPLYRYEMQAQRVTGRARVRGDSAAVPVRQVDREAGTFVWHPTLGLVRRDRHIVVETSVPAGRRVRQPVRSRIEQRITLERDLMAPPDEAGRCANSS